MVLRSVRAPVAAPSAREIHELPFVLARHRTIAHYPAASARGLHPHGTAGPRSDLDGCPLANRKPPRARLGKRLSEATHDEGRPEFRLFRGGVACARRFRGAPAAKRGL